MAFPFEGNRDAEAFCRFECLFGRLAGKLIVLTSPEMSEAATEQEVSRLFRVRRTVLELLSDRGYAVLNSEEDLLQPRDVFEAEFSTHNYNRESLTLLRQKRDDATDQIYVFFPDEQRNKLLGVKPISERAERMERDSVRSAIIILQTGLTPYAKSAVEKLSAGARYRMEVFLENELIVNITKHVLVPKHVVLSDEEKRKLLQRYKLKESQLPRIQKSDPIARYYGLSHGTVVKITRPSETAGRYVTYRLCVG